MIQEKDFLYRVPVKSVLVTTPNQQVRNPEILVDLEGGEFMHGNILDANSTNKLINQSVKDAVDNKLIESGYVTQDLLDAETTRATEQENSLKTLIGAETSARTKGDESLSAKIKAEQTRAEGKEKEISDKLAIVDGDSNTEGSFRKAIADVIAAAPEDLDTLKEIADKLADNDDLHTVLNQAITDKADASALLNEVTRATGAESALQAAIDTKQPKGNYLTEHQSLEEYAKKTDIPEIDTSDFVSKTATDNQIIRSLLSVKNTLLVNGDILASGDRDCRIKIHNSTDSDTYSALGYNFVSVRDRIAEMRNTSDSITSFKLDRSQPTGLGDAIFSLSKNGVRLLNGDTHHVLTSDASTIDITQYALKSQLDTKADNLELAALEQQVADNSKRIEGKQNKGNYIPYNNTIPDFYTVTTPISLLLGNGYKTDLRRGDIKITNSDGGNLTMSCGQIASTLDGKNYSFALSGSGIILSQGEKIQITYNSGFVMKDQYDTTILSLGPSGIMFEGRTNTQIPTAAGDFISIDDYVNTHEYDQKITELEDSITSLTSGLNHKQDKIKVNSVDVTNLNKANLDQLINIVQELLIALDSSGLIIMEDGLE